MAQRRATDGCDLTSGLGPLRRSSGPALALLLALACASCGEPTAGGQTGDPGVVDNTPIPGAPDYSSLDPSMIAGMPGHVPGPGGPPGGPCSSVPLTGVVREPSGGNLVALDLARALFIDRSSGRVVDLADPAAPRTRARLDVGELTFAQRIRDGRALLSVHRASANFALDATQAAALGDDRVMLVDFADPDAPVVLTDQAVPGDIALSAVVERTDGVRVYALADEIVADCIAPTKHSTLYRFALNGDALEPDGTLELGDQVGAVAVRDGQLIVLDGLPGSAGPSSLRVVALDADVAALQASAAVSAPGPLSFQPQLWIERRGAILTVLAVSSEAHVARYDMSDSAAPHMLADCTLEGVGELGGLWLSGEHALVTTWPNQDGNRLLEIDPATCAISERQDLWLAKVASSDALIELDFASPDTIEARLVTSTETAPIATARATLDPALGPFGQPSSLPWANSVLANAVSWPGDGATTETNLLAVPLQRANGKQGGPAIVQLFSFSADSISVRATLAPAWTLAASTPSGVATTSLGDHAVLTSFTLDAQRTPEALATLELSPMFARGYALDDQHWARLRTPLGLDRIAQEDLSDDALLHPDPSVRASLEVIAIGGDPEQVPALAHVELNPYAQLVRVGKLFVSVANREQSAPGTTRLELFDFSDPLAPIGRGTLESDALWAQDNTGTLRGPGIECLDCDAPGGDGPIGLGTAHAFVLRGYRWIGDENGHSAFAFEIVDLSDPDHPKLGRTLTMPDEDRAYGAVALGDDVYYRYARPVTGDPTRLRFLVQRIGLADPARPELPAPVVVPGELVAVRDQRTLYTVELTRSGTHVQATLHRASVRDGGARIEASYVLGERRPIAVTLDDDRVLVDLGPRFDAPAPVTDSSGETDEPVHLIVLDADSLEPRAQSDIAYGVTPLGAANGTAVYATWAGALLVDVNAPDDATRQRALSNSGVPISNARAIFADDHVLLVDPQGGTLRELALEVDKP